MKRDWYQHPRRFPKNAVGPFYSTGEPECGDCLVCGAPEAEAPELLASLEGENCDTYFVRQPSTPEEIERACNAARVCCVSAIRYGGTDEAIIRLLGNHPDRCDYTIAISGALTLNTARKSSPSGMILRVRRAFNPRGLPFRRWIGTPHAMILISAISWFLFLTLRASSRVAPN